MRPWRDDRSASFDSARQKTAGAAQDASLLLRRLDSCLILIPKRAREHVAASTHLRPVG